MVILGAGPAGLAIAGHLSKAGIEYVILEQRTTAVPSWKAHYDRLHLHTLKEFSDLPYKAFSKELPKYVSRKELVAYYESYCEEFDIKPVFNTTIQSVTQIEHSVNRWKIEATDGRSWETNQLVVACGYNRLPRMPQWKGMEHFKGQLMHSQSYKNPAQLASGGKVETLVVGMGNSGAEIALDLAEHGHPTSLSVRSPVNVVPRDFLGRGVQKTSFFIQKLPFPIANKLAPIVPKLVFGNLEKYGIPKSPLSPLEQTVRHGKTPVIDVGTIAKIKEGAIEVKSDISHFEGNEVHFKDGSSKIYGAVVMATGYTTGLEKLVPAVKDRLDRGIARSISYQDLPGLYFLGYNVFANGVLWAIKKESFQIFETIQQDLAN